MEPPQKVVIFQAPFLKSTPSWNTFKMLFKDPNYAPKLPNNFKYQNIDVKCSKTNIIKAQKATSFLIIKYKIRASRLKLSHTKFDFLLILI